MSLKSAWFITAKTNLHVGNENTSNYGLIDKAIQRDVLTKLPCINSSSLKGSINEYCTQVAGLDSDERIRIFGVDKGNKKSATQKGSDTFFDADLLLLPVQDDTCLYHWVTTKSILKGLVEKMKIFDVIFNGSEDENALLLVIKELFNQREIKIISDEQFSNLCSDEELPIIARNCLEDGQSTNLWYEQILPSETVFYTIMHSADDTLSKAINNKIIQIGANATIGYGYCRLSKME